MQLCMHACLRASVCASCGCATLHMCMSLFKDFFILFTFYFKVVCLCACWGHLSPCIYARRYVRLHPCMHISMSTCVYMYTYTHAYLCRSWIVTCMCDYIYIYVFMHVNKYLHTYMFISSSICLYIYIYIYTFNYWYSHIHACRCACMHVCVYVYADRCVCIVHAYMCILPPTHTCLLTYIQADRCTHASIPRTHTHTHTYRPHTRNTSDIDTHTPT